MFCTNVSLVYNRYVWTCLWFDEALSANISSWLDYLLFFIRHTFQTSPKGRRKRVVAYVEWLTISIKIKHSLELKILKWNWVSQKPIGIDVRTDIMSSKSLMSAHSRTMMEERTIITNEGTQSCTITHPLVLRREVSQKVGSPGKFRRHSISLIDPNSIQGTSF